MEFAGERYIRGTIDITLDIDSLFAEARWAERPGKQQTFDAEIFPPVKVA
jgi:hypothetical protein